VDKRPAVGAKADGVYRAAYAGDGTQFPAAFQIPQFNSAVKGD